MISYIYIVYTTYNVGKLKYSTIRFYIIMFYYSLMAFLWQWKVYFASSMEMIFMKLLKELKFDLPLQMPFNYSANSIYAYSYFCSSTLYWAYSLLYSTMLMNHYQWVLLLVHINVLIICIISHWLQLQHIFQLVHSSNYLTR